MNARTLLTLTLGALPTEAVDDVFRFDGPRYVDRSTCHVFSKGVGREACHAPEGDPAGGGGGSDKQFSQADVDRIVQDRVKSMKAELETLRASVKDIDEIKAKLAEADEREVKAREEAELKGKSELEKLQIQLKKAGEKLETANGEWGKRLAEEQARSKAAADGLTEYVRRHHVTSALSEAGLAKGASKAAVLAFLSEAQIELGEQHEIKSIAIGGKSFDKPGEAAKHFLTENPFFAAPAQGGGGTPRPGGNGHQPNGAEATSVAGLISAGLAQRSG